MAKNYWIIRTLSLTFLLVCMCATAFADTLTQVTSPAGQASTDSILWSQLGGDQHVLGTSFSVTTGLGTSDSVTMGSANGIISIVCTATPSNCSWTGATTGMAAGDSLIWTSDAANGGSGPVTISFASPITGAGAYIQADIPGQFTAKLEAFNGGTSLGFFTTVSNTNGDPVYLGLNDSSGAHVTSVRYSLTTCAANCTDFGLDKLLIKGSSAGGTPAAITSPTPGTKLSGASATFNWTTGTGVTQYSLYIGTSAGAHDVDFFNEGTKTSQLVTNLPTNGLPLYVTLYSLINGAYQSNAYTYTQAGTPTPSTMTSPAQGSKLAGSSVTFQWTTAPGATQYSLYVGTQPGTHDVDFLNAGKTTSHTFTNIPTSGGTLFVTLYTFFPGSYQSHSYTYIQSGTPAKATMTSPANGATITGSSATFNWSAGTGVTSYSLYVGTTRGAHDLDFFNTSAHSASVSNLPATGGTIYVRLYSLIDGAWQFNDYTYTNP